MPTPLEIAVDWVFGVDRPEPPSPEEPPHPVVALERVLLRALRRPPCLISFSGGRDSTALLGVAVRLARREGLPLPVPSSQQFPRDHEADEREWQELVVRELGIDEWHRVVVTDDFDLIGPVARDMWRRHGFVWPPGVHVALPGIDEARGGSFVTGDPGDDLFLGWPWHEAADVLYRRHGLTPRRLVHTARALAPPPFKRWWSARRNPWTPDWLLPASRSEAERQWHRVSAAAPLRYDRFVEWMGRQRAYSRSLQNLAALARAGDVATFHPFFDLSFRRALGAWAGPTGPGTRTHAMRALFSGIAPDAVLERTTKGHSSNVLWGSKTRAFVHEWSGRGLWSDLVDPGALRPLWAGRWPAGGSFHGLLQLAYLADRTGSHAQDLVDQSVDTSDV